MGRLLQRAAEQIPRLHLQATDGIMDAAAKLDPEDEHGAVAVSEQEFAKMHATVGCRGARRCCGESDTRAALQVAKLFSAAISLFESPDTPELAAVPAVPAAAALATPSSDATPEPLRVLEWGGGLDQSYFVESLDCEVGAARRRAIAKAASSRPRSACCNCQRARPTPWRSSVRHARALCPPAAAAALTPGDSWRGPAVVAAFHAHRGGRGRERGQGEEGSGQGQGRRGRRRAGRPACAPERGGGAPARPRARRPEHRPRLVRLGLQPAGDGCGPALPHARTAALTRRVQVAGTCCAGGWTLALWRR
jgi:hypothetical protein